MQRMNSSMLNEDSERQTSVPYDVFRSEDDLFSDTYLLNPVDTEHHENIEKAIADRISAAAANGPS